MEIVGLIAEYNPFHNGHLYQIKKIKELYPDSIIILILNGYFLERGEISIINKERKTEIALNYDIDLVIELPFVFGTQSADIFALNAIKILDSLKATKLIFGSESNNIALLNKIVDIELYDSSYQDNIKKYLDQGLNYPTALAKALNIKEGFNNPNDLLGISYIKAIKTINSSIIPETIKRTNNYHDLDSNDNIISASNIREKLNNNMNIDKFLPSLSKKYIAIPNSYFYLLKYKILTSKDLSIYLTVDEGIENRLIKAARISNNISELILNTKTKRYTFNKINRMLIHILIGFTKKDKENINLDYIKVLGFNKKGQNYLNKIKKESIIPITINPDSLVYKYELKAATIYDLLTNQKTVNFEIKNKPIKYNDFEQ